MCLLLYRGRELHRIIHASLLDYFDLIPMCLFSVLSVEDHLQVLYLWKTQLLYRTPNQQGLLCCSQVLSLKYFSHYTNDSLQPGSHARHMLTVTYSSLYTAHLAKYVECRSCSINTFCTEMNRPTVSQFLSHDFSFTFGSSPRRT